MKVIIGSTSVLKTKAVILILAAEPHALSQLNEIYSTKVTSGVNEQPIGLEETLRGATNRAEAAQKEYPECLAIGIESGLIREKGISVDMAVIVFLTPDGRKIVTTSPGIVFPEEYVKITEERGFATTTVGSVIAEKLGGDKSNPHHQLTDAKTSRLKMLTMGVRLAAEQL